MKITLKREIFNDIYLPHLEKMDPIEIYYGGGGSGKSVFVMQKIIYNTLKTKGYNWLLTRKVAATIKLSIWPLMMKTLSQWRLTKFVKINKTDKRITFPNGNEIVCAGLDDVEKLKSITFQTGVLTGIWCEEASETEESDLVLLQIRLRGRAPVRKTIILSFNPINQEHWLKTRFFDRPQEGVMVLKSTYLNNKFLDDEDKKRLEDLKLTDPDFYRVYALGDWGVVGNRVFSNFVIEKFKYTWDSFDQVYVGMDFGFNHASALEACGIKDGELYVFDEIYVRGIGNTELINMVRAWLPNKSQLIIADSAEPDRIREFQQAGFKVLPATKGPGSLLSGVDYLRGLRIHIHAEKCAGLASEFPRYHYREKKGTVLDEPIQVNDDAIAGLRYGTEHLWKHKLCLNKNKVSAGGLGL